jgi:hypothetical protein
VSSGDRFVRIHPIHHGVGGDPAEVLMRLAVVPTVDDPDGELWGLYCRAFDDLRTRAVQRHLMVRAEFDALMADPRVDKFIAISEARTVVGLATMTNDLTAVPLISPEFFAHRWPDLYDRRRVWYVGFVAVDPVHQAAGVMGRIIDRMGTEVDVTVGGVICVDISEQRELAQRLPTVIEAQARRSAPGITRVRLDAQVYWGYEFPTPA